MKKEEELKIVGDFTNSKPFMIVKYLFGDNNYVGHKVMDRFKTAKEAKKAKNKLLQI